jgi:hypothetical protein
MCCISATESCDHYRGSLLLLSGRRDTPISGIPLLYVMKGGFISFVKCRGKQVQLPQWEREASVVLLSGRGHVSTGGEEIEAQAPNISWQWTDYFSFQMVQPLDLYLYLFGERMVVDQNQDELTWIGDWKAVAPAASCRALHDALAPQHNADRISIPVCTLFAGRCRSGQWCLRWNCRISPGRQSVVPADCIHMLFMPK